ncbi:MAG: ABC transporter permease [Actinomyces sp.]|nr:MAG: ABC transporter permease [Actinomyces sp.]
MSPEPRSVARSLLPGTAAVLAPVAVFVVSLSVGRYPVSLDSLWSSAVTWASGQEMSRADIALMTIRMPRLCLALMVGAALSASGTAFQGLFRNPVVSPDLLGASSGASFGAALAILLGLSGPLVQALSFATGLVAVLLVATLAALVDRRTSGIVTMILCGMLVSSVFNAAVSLIKFVADTDTKLPAITYWLMGSLAGTRVDSLSTIWVFAPACLLLYTLSWKLNVLAMGDEEARMLGVNVRLYRWLIIACATLLTSTSVSVSGNIGWIGLVVPHLARKLVGPDHVRLMWASMSIGAAFLLLVDTIARLASTVEIPLGIITAFIGAPFFFTLILRSRRGFLQ